MIREHKGHRAAVHAGGDLGFASMLILLPGLSTAVLMMKNAGFGPGEELAYAVLDCALGEEPEPLGAPVMYPDSSKAYDSYAEACLISGDRQHGSINYKK